MDTPLALKIPPGMRNNGTVYQSKGRWYTGNFVRFFQDTIQPIGGWSAFTITGVTGTPRAVMGMFVNGSPCWVIGTTTGAFAITGIGASSGTVTDISFAGIATQATRLWQFSAFGDYLYATDCYSGSQYYWDGNTAHDLTLISNGRNDGFGGDLGQRSISSTVTPERFAVALGGDVPDSLVSFPAVAMSNDKLVVWADQEALTAASDWKATTTNAAGDFLLPTKGQIQCGKPARTCTLIWTTADVWTMTYIGGEFIYRFDQVGDNCGSISRNAAVVLDTAAFWMGTDGFYAYDGFVKPIPCEVYDYVFGSLNRTYQHLIWAIDNPTFGEATWFYPHAAQTECTRYATFNYRENHWVTGTLSRCCGTSYAPRASLQMLPILATTAPALYLHETGTGRNSEGTPSLESGPLELGDGERLVQVQSVLPDDKLGSDTLSADKTPAVNLTLYGAMDADSGETTYGPYTLTHRTTFRAKMRQVRVKLTETVASAWRVGVIRLGVIPSSRR